MKSVANWPDLAPAPIDTLLEFLEKLLVGSSLAWSLLFSTFPSLQNVGEHSWEKAFDVQSLCFYTFFGKLSIFEHFKIFTGRQFYTINVANLIKSKSGYQKFQK